MISAGIGVRNAAENLPVSLGGGMVSDSMMHLAKDLEFRAVAVMACDDEIIPLKERTITQNPWPLSGAFGSEDKPVRIKSMNNSLQPHTPFAELPVQARALFFIYASAANARFGVRPPTPTDLASQLESIWNGHRLRDEDLSDPDRLTALLKEHLAPATRTVTNHAFDGHTRCPRAK